MIKGNNRMVNHRTTEVWMGSACETLADLVPPNLRAMCVGINPSPVSVKVGHYYQGRLGKNFYQRIRTAGVIPDQIAGYYDDVCLTHGIGFTDIVKRPTGGAAELRPEEYAFGKTLLMNKLQTWRPPVILFTFKKSATELLGGFAGCGLINKPLGGSRVFVMPGPYASRDEVAAQLRSLRAVLSV